MKRYGHKSFKTDYKYVRRFVWEDNTVAFAFNYTIKIRGRIAHVSKTGFKTARSAALALDKYLISVGKPPFVFKKL